MITIFAPSSTATRIEWMSSPGVNSPGSTCCIEIRPALMCSDKFYAQRLAARDHRLRHFVEQEQRRALAALRGMGREFRGQRGFPGTRSTDYQSARPFLDSAAEQRVEFRDTALQLPPVGVLPMLGGNEPREHNDAAGSEDVVVISAAEFHAATLEHAQAATLPAVLRMQLLEQHDAVRNAAHLHIVVVSRQVVEQQYRAGARRKVVLQRENLSAVSQCASREQTKFGQRVKDQAFGLQPFDVLKYALRGMHKLELRGVKHHVLLVGLELGLGRCELTHGDAVEIPAMRFGDGPQLLFRFRKRHVQHRLTVRRPCHQKLHRQRCLSGTGHPLDQEQSIARETARQNVVEADDAGTLPSLGVT